MPAAVSENNGRITLGARCPGPPAPALSSRYIRCCRVRPPVSPGDPRHPDFPLFLARLGAATYEAARVAGICFDLARVFDCVPSEAMYDDPLGALQQRLLKLSRRAPELPGLVQFLDKLERARMTRNDLLHALPVRDGPHRRRRDDLHYVRNFLSLQVLELATADLRDAHHRRRGDSLPRRRRGCSPVERGCRRRLDVVRLSAMTRDAQSGAPRPDVTVRHRRR